MDTPNEHINPWAEKLQELNTAGASESWQAMSALLDTEMPVRKDKNRRRWFLLTLLLLLLIGVCRFPHSDQSVRKGTTVVKMNPETGTRSVTGSVAPVTSPESPEAAETINLKTAPVKEKSSKHFSTGTMPFLSAETAREEHSNQRKKNLSAYSNGGNGSARTLSSAADESKESGPANENKHVSSSGDEQISNADTALVALQKTGNPGQLDSSGRKPVAAQPGAKTKPSTTAKQPEKDSIQDSRGWTVGLGLNQFFAIAGQQSSRFNSDGTSGNLSDYIPVPVLRYYFHQWFYLQAEAQINSPQYTQTLLAGQGIKSAALTGEDAVQSVFIKKLFYFNIPVSVHYSPVKNLFLGVGLQYSRLTNGVALIQDTRLNGGYIPNQVRPGDTILIETKTASLKQDPAYRHLRTQEWRFLADLNYQWKRLTIGLRYNQAFSDFINLRVSSLHLTQAQNRSVQVYLRYSILDRRRKFMIARP